MSEVYALAPTEVLDDRPFTNLVHTGQDLAALTYALAMLRSVLQKSAQPSGQELKQQILFWPEADGRLHRLILNDAQALRTMAHLVLVGFFGQRRRDVDATVVDVIDTDLVDELRAHLDILAYCSCALESGEYGNLVLFRREEGKSHWATSALHLRAVQTLSPKYYDSVRLHNGFVTGGLAAGNPPVLQRTKYYDYQGMLAWRGVRELDASAVA
ncbi:MAG: hypothetical protein M3Q45_12860 [Chloroflexota bacterium]|nr:hypothetical protein [Chloroflexota bacterium]